MARNYAALPHEYLDEMAELTDEEFGRICRALLRYSITGEIAEPVGNERFYTRRVIAQEDRFQASYDELAQKRSNQAKKAAAARWNAQSMPGHARDANTETETKTKLNQTYSTPSRRTGGRGKAADAANEERLRKDMEELAQFVERAKGVEP